MSKAKTVKRSFGMDSKTIQEMATQYRKDRKFPQPFNRGNYHFILQGLIDLGKDRWHSLKDVSKAFRKSAGEEWFADWQTKKPRNKNGLDAEGRFVQNIMVMQRIKDYGLSLLQCGKIIGSKGVVVDVRRAEKTYDIRLNTDSAEPIKAGRIAKVEAKALPKIVKATKSKKAA